MQTSGYAAAAARIHTKSNMCPPWWGDIIIMHDFRTEHDCRNDKKVVKTYDKSTIQNNNKLKTDIMKIIESSVEGR